MFPPNPKFPIPNNLLTHYLTNSTYLAGGTMNPLPGQKASSPSLRLTAEQEAIIASSGNIRINAVAGSGKTTTIIQHAATRPQGSRMLYLAFNKTVRQEAKRRFAEQGLHRVQVETAHSLAYKAVVQGSRYTVRPQGYKTHEVAELLGLKDHGEKHGAYILANHVSRFMSYFCNSDVKKVQQLNYIDTVVDEKAKAFVQNYYAYIVEGTRHLLKKMNDGSIDITHDFYLKLYQLSNPVLPFDYILFDEGQDASPAMLDVFLKQKAAKVIVGDTHQQIYAWRYAVNSLEKVDFAGYPLSTSFRFGKDIAALASQVLHWKAHLQETGPVVIDGKGTSTARQTVATIARTNLGLLLSAIQYITEHKNTKHLYFEGNINSYTYADDGASLYDVLSLYNGRQEGIRDKIIQSMKTMDELEDYIEKTEDVQLGMMVEIVKEYGNEIPRLIKELKNKHVGDNEKEKAEMIFSTVHRCKGMEYDWVNLAADFITEARLQKLKEEKEELTKNVVRWNEEINLLYVAITRAKSLLHIPESLLPKDFPESKHIHVTRKEKDSTAVSAAGYSTKKETGYHETLLAYKNAGAFWTEERDDELRRLFHQGTSIGAIAKRFGTKPGIIFSRLQKIGCVTEG
ncbi:MAG TPA: UvrD-helicase domain-containing protein [Flavisolibacter sp.]|nr:UvrD-helicase domain-containing protein [Flavisolibacter sp.]